MHRAITRILVAASVLLMVVGANQAVAAAAPPPDLAVFEWYKLSQLNAKVSEPRLTTLRTDGFKTVYANVGEYLEVADQPDSRAQRTRLAQLKSDLKRFVARASNLGFAVHAVAGGPDWTDVSHRYLGPKLVQLVADYNGAAAPNERLQGVQLDIEPYVDPGFFDDTEAALIAYLQTMRDIVAAYRQVRARSGNHTLRLGVAIPFWFDGEAGAPGPVPFGGATKPAAFHLVDMLADLAHAYLVVMAYRNFTAGEDGSISHLRSEFEYLSSAGARCGLVVGQEYTEQEPPEVSFHGLGRGVFRTAAAEIAAAYGHLPQFGGLSVNDVDAYLAADE